MGAMLRRPFPLRCWVLPSLLVVNLVSSPAEAATAADKATARTLAMEGVALFQKGDCKQAVERLRRAQQLYPAPVHLLYIARCQVDGGQLVEASETYRELARAKLDADAPPQFREAVREGQRELAALQPTIPRLRIEVTPRPSKLKLTIDGEPVPEAVLGVERLTNPGRHRVVVTVPGVAPITREVVLERGTVEGVTFELGTLPPPAAPPPADKRRPAAEQPKSDSATKRGKKAAKSEPSNAKAASATPESEAPNDTAHDGGNGRIWFLGLDLGVAIPGGNLREGDAFRMNQLFKTGGGLQFIAGLTFYRYFTPYFYAQGLKFDAASGDKDKVGTPQGAEGSMVGIGGRFGSPRRRLGGFGNVDFAFVNRMTATRSFTGAAGLRSQECKATFSGSAIRFGGGVNIPLERWVELVPYANVAFSTFTSMTAPNADGCDAVWKVAGVEPGSIPDSERSGHFLVGIGVGGEFLLGGH